jgi:hypothetical protein
VNDPYPHVAREVTACISKMVPGQRSTYLQRLYLGMGYEARWIRKPWYAAMDVEEMMWTKTSCSLSCILEVCSYRSA